MVFLPYAKLAQTFFYCMLSMCKPDLDRHALDAYPDPYPTKWCGSDPDPQHWLPCRSSSDFMQAVMIFCKPLFGSCPGHHGFLTSHHQGSHANTNEIQGCTPAELGSRFSCLLSHWLSWFSCRLSTWLCHPLAIIMVSCRLSTWLCHSGIYHDVMQAIMMGCQSRGGSPMSDAGYATSAGTHSIGSSDCFMVPVLWYKYKTELHSGF